MAERRKRLNYEKDKRQLLSFKFPSWFSFLLCVSCFTFYVLSAGCAWSGADRAPAAHPPKEALSKILAAPLPIPDWLPAGDITFYDEENLFEYIDGESETYFAYDFLLLATKDYIHARDASMRLVVDVYDMKLPANAFGVYSVGRTPDEQFVKLGQGGYVLEDTVLFYKNRYFVEIYPFRPFPKAQEAGLKLAGAISVRIPKAKEGPHLLRYLPPEGLVEKSATYYLRSLLGYSFLNNGITAEYIVEGERLTIFLCEYADLKEARNAASAFKGKIEETEALSRKVRALGEQSFGGTAKYIGPVVVFRQGRFLAGAKLGKFKGSPHRVLEALSSRLPG